MKFRIPRVVEAGERKISLWEFVEKFDSWEWHHKNREIRIDAIGVFAALQLLRRAHIQSCCFETVLKHEIYNRPYRKISQESTISMFMRGKAYLFSFRFRGGGGD